MGSAPGIWLWIFGALGIFPDGQTYAVAFGAFFGLMELSRSSARSSARCRRSSSRCSRTRSSRCGSRCCSSALQQLEGHVVAPQVFGHSLRINPLLVIFALLFGGAVAGFIGALMALPIAAVIRETVVYLRRHVVFEPWGDATPLTVIGA